MGEVSLPETLTFVIVIISGPASTQKALNNGLKNSGLYVECALVRLACMELWDQKASNGSLAMVPPNSTSTRPSSSTLSPGHGIIPRV